MTDILLLQTLDYSFRSEPFCNISSKLSAKTETLDYSFNAAPFVARTGIPMVIVGTMPAVITASVPTPELILLSGIIFDAKTIINTSLTYSNILFILNNIYAELIVEASIDLVTDSIRHSDAIIKCEAIRSIVGLMESFTMPVEPAIINSVSSIAEIYLYNILRTPSVIGINASIKNVFNNSINRIIANRAIIRSFPRILTISKVITGSIGVIQSTGQCVLSEVSIVVLNPKATISAVFTINTIKQICNQNISTIHMSYYNCIANMTARNTIAIINQSISYSKIYTSIMSYDSTKNVSEENLISLDFCYDASPHSQAATWTDRLLKGIDNEEFPYGESLNISFRAEPFIFLAKDFISNNRNYNHGIPMKVYKRYNYTQYEQNDGKRYKGLKM